MIKLELLPETTLQLQVAEKVIKTAPPVTAPKHITENGTYAAKEEGVYGFDPVTVEVDMTKAQEEGRQAEYHRFWDAYQDYGNRTDYGYAFRLAYWNNANFRPKYDIVVSSHGVGNLFENCGYEGDLVALCQKQGITIDFSNGAEFSRTFYGTKFTRIGTIDARKATRFYYVFNYSNSLHTIDKIICAESTPFNSAFGGLKALEQIRFEGTIGVSLSINDSPLLSAQSVDSILSCLKDLTGAVTQTLTLHKDVGAKLTNEQKAAITAKNWTLVY